MDYKSIVLSTEIPSFELERGGREFTIPVKVKNGSGTDLFSFQDIFITYHIMDLDGNVLRWDNERTELTVLNDRMEIINVTGTAPNEAGEYLLVIDIVMEGVEWYSVKGMNVINVPIKVQNRGSKYFNELEKEIQVQDEVRNFLEKKLISGQYKLEKPYVSLNPYGKSPLTAIILFQTEVPMCITVKIEGKTKEAEIKGKIKEYTTEHIIPIYGLYADFLNTVIITGETKEGIKRKSILKIQTEGLPEDFNDINIKTYIGDSAQYEPGINFCYTGNECKGIKYAYDINGDIRWCLPEEFAWPTNYNSSTSVWVLKQSDEIRDMLEGMYCEYTLLGQIRTAFLTSYWVHHDIWFTSRETFYMLINSEDTVHDAAIEVNCKTGEILHYYNYKKMFMKTRNISEIYTNKDWLHMNALVEHNGDIIVSGNTQSTIMKHDKEGNIKWILADPVGYTTYWKNLALTPIGENFEYFYNQHAIEILPDMDGNPDTFDMLLFDNGISRNKCNDLDKEENPPYSRIVHYRINEKNRTVEQIWEYGKDRKELYSMWRGDANHLANGNILGVFNLRDKNDIDGKAYMESCVCVEVDRDKNVIWESYGCSDKTRNSYQNYRMERKEMYDSEEGNVDLSHEVKIVEVRRKS